MWMNKWVLYLCCFFPLGGWVQAVSNPTKLDAVEKEIEFLKKRLHQEQLETMQEEVKGQEFMIADWANYAQEIEDVRKQEKESEQIRQQIKKLEEKKARLMQLKDKGPKGQQGH